jgi:hypothetical protein
VGVILGNIIWSHPPIRLARNDGSISELDKFQNNDRPLEAPTASERDVECEYQATYCCWHELGVNELYAGLRGYYATVVTLFQ